MNDYKQWVSQIFDRAAPDYGEKSASFFNYFGKRLVEQVKIEPHYSVLDVATGRGAVLFPLVEKMDPNAGKVIGIDISQQMLQETSREMAQKGIKNVALFYMDAEKIDFPDESFDCLFCGFALFFFPSLLKALSEFKRVLKPEGTLAVSTWGEDSNLDTLVNSKIKKYIQIPSLAATPIWCASELRKILSSAGFENIEIQEETKTFIHASSHEWWDSLWTHGIRAKLERLSPQHLAMLKQEVLEGTTAHLKKEQLEEDLQVFYGVAKKP